MDKLEEKFWSIAIYVDKNETLIGVPCGLSEKYGVADIDKVMILKTPYSDERVEKYVEEIIDACYTKRHNDESDYSTIEKYTKIKGFVNATKELTLITIVKVTNEGYTIAPAFNDFERGPVLIDDDEIKLSMNYRKGEMATTIKRMIEVYLKANFAKKEQDE